MSPRWNVAMVTGASSGIGDAIARQLAAAGTSLVVVARNAGRLDQLASELGDSHGVTVEVLPADLADPEDLRAVERRLGSTPGIDLLVNNAGFATVGPFAETDVDTEERQVAVNVVAPLRLTRAAVTRRRTRSAISRHPGRRGRRELAVKPVGRSSRPADGVPSRGSGSRDTGDVGVLAEVFRQQPGTAVNDHPEGRFGARGRRAGALMADAPWHDYYGPGSPLERFVDAGGKVVRLGADLDTVTVLHFAEYLVPLEGKRRVRRHCLVRDRDGRPEVRAVECLDDSDGIVDHPGEDYFAQILRAYLATGRARTGRVGHAPTEVIDAADIVAFGVEWMTGHLSRV